MAGRLVQLNTSKGGISRLRIKGGAEASTLYDLINGYVDQSGAVQSRPGTVEDYLLPAGTIGMVAINGGLTVFSGEVIGGIPDGITLEVMPHPTDAAQQLIKIHFAGPFLGDDTGAFLYVVAEYTNGDVFHFWLQRGDPWQANHNYGAVALVSPTTPNGFIYQANRLGEPGTIWAPNVERQVGDVVEPTVFNGYEYECIEADGSPPRSGTVEPDWSTEEGAVVVEEADVTPPAGDGGQTQPPPSPPPRYDNPGGGRPNDGRTNTVAF